MKKLLTTPFIFLIAFISKGQQLSQVSFLDGATLSYFSVRTGQDVLVRISIDGKLMEWGTEVLSERGNYYAPRLQPFYARVENYEGSSDSAYKGKVKSIGTCFITYYGAYEEESKRGKIKSMGSLQFDYYSKYDEKSLQGKLKMVGNLILEYYRLYDNEAFRGKLKAIGSLPITYYSAFDDKYNTGKLKSIGPVSYVWFSPLNSTQQYRGGLKTNNYRQFISGINFILR